MAASICRTVENMLLLTGLESSTTNFHDKLLSALAAVIILLHYSFVTLFSEYVSWLEEKGRTF